MYINCPRDSNPGSSVLQGICSAGERDGHYATPTGLLSEIFDMNIFLEKHVVMRNRMEDVEDNSL
jgi:hypothetical protein